MVHGGRPINLVLSKHLLYLGVHIRFPQHDFPYGSRRQWRMRIHVLDCIIIFPR